MPPNQESVIPQNRTKVVLGIFAVVVVLLLVVVWDYRNSPFLSKFLGSTVATTTPNGSGAELINRVTYVCSANKTIDASYFDTKNHPVAQSGEMPQPTGSVSLVLSDGRSMTLPQTISGSGVRYANHDETIIFWNKGDTAFIEEGANQDQTYIGCIASKAVVGTENWSVFASTTMGITVRYPSDYAKRPGYTYELRGPDVPPISGVKFIIPAKLYQGTNLSGFDTGVSVEQLPDATTCPATAFLPDISATVRTVKEGDTTYSVATYSDAGAGNFYEQTVYALQGTSICTGVRYFIHSTNIGNYTPGTVKAFDKTALLAQFDQIRQTLVIGQ